MKIQLERSGGFANIPLRKELDSAELSPAKAAELEKLVEKVRLLDQPPQPPGPSQWPDDFQYDITIEDAGHTQTFRTTESTATDDLTLLLEFLSGAIFGKVRRG